MELDDTLDWEILILNSFYAVVVVTVAAEAEPKPLILSHRRQRQEAGRSEFEGNLLHCEFHGSKGHRETLS